MTSCSGKLQVLATVVGPDHWAIVPLILRTHLRVMAASSQAILNPYRHARLTLIGQSPSFSGRDGIPKEALKDVLLG
jgi:hypothetical protein